MRTCIFFAVAVSSLSLSLLTAQTSKPLKVHISVDMEGIAGVVSTDQLGPGSFEYERFRQFMTREAVAAVEGAKAAGALEIVVADSHGNGENLLIEAFPPGVRVVRGFPRRLGMMAGIDSTFDAAVFIGYHASTSNTKGVRAHTFSSAQLTRVAVNNQEVTEGAWNAAIAGHYGVPVLFVSGDEAAVAEVKNALGPIGSVATKKPLSFHSAENMLPSAAADAIRQGVKSALETAPGARKLYKVTAPVTVEISFKHYRPVELLSYLKTFERVSSHTIRFIAKDMVEASDLETFITSYQIGLEP